MMRPFQKSASASLAGDEADHAGSQSQGSAAAAQGRITVGSEPNATPTSQSAVGVGISSELARAAEIAAMVFGDGSLAYDPDGAPMSPGDEPDSTKWNLSHIEVAWRKLYTYEEQKTRLGVSEYICRALRLHG